MKPIWEGALRFGLINIPVGIYKATKEERVNFDYLHKKDLSPVRYARVCRREEREIPYEDIVRGYEYQKDDYIVLTDEDLKKANVEKYKTIDIVGFTKKNDIDEIYFEKPFYLEPGKDADRAYILLREALKRSGKVAIAKFVLRSREHLGIIKPETDLLVLGQLRYNDEILPPKGLKMPKREQIVEDDELALAIAFIDQLTETFRPEQYKDTYREEIERVISEKIRGRKPQPKGKEPKYTRAKDIMALLKASLERGGESTAVG